MIFRLKVFLPIFLSVCSLCLAASFLLEPWLKKKLEETISSVTETRTNISGLSLSFKNSSLKIRKLEIASQENEFKNSIQIENIVVDFETLPLFHKRLVVNNFSVEGIAFGTPRKSSGKLSEQELKNHPSLIATASDAAMLKLRQEFDELPVAKILVFQVPENPREVVEALNLKSLDAYKLAIVQAQEMRSAWTLKMNDLKDQREEEKRIHDLRDLVKQPAQNPSEALERAKAVEESISFFEAEKKKLDGWMVTIRSETQKIIASQLTAQKAIETDLAKARSAVNLDQLNIGNFSRLLFGLDWVKRVEQILRYQKLLRQLLIHPSGAEEDGVQVTKLKKGRDISFVAPEVAPQFVLQKSEFSLRSSGEGTERTEMSQTYDLKLLDINSSPLLYGKPSNIHFVGKFRGLAIGAASADAFWDYTQPKTPTDRYHFEVSRIDANTWPVGIPEVFPVQIEKGLADASSEFVAEGDGLEWKSTIKFSDVAWDFKKIPKHGQLIPVLQDVFQKVKNFELKIRLVKKAGKLDLDFESDMDEGVKQGISAAMDKQLKEFEARLKREMEGRTATLRGEAQKQASAYQAEVTSRVFASSAQVEQYLTEAKDGLESLKKKAEKAAASQLKKSIPLALPKVLP